MTGFWTIVFIVEQSEQFPYFLIVVRTTPDDDDVDAGFWAGKGYAVLIVWARQEQTLTYVYNTMQSLLHMFESRMHIQFKQKPVPTSS